MQRAGWLLRGSLFVGVALSTGVAHGAGGADVDWPSYGGDAAKTRHSTLADIHRGNVSGLALAWTHDTKEKGDTQTQPIVVGRVLYGYTPTHKAFALDAATGKQLWLFDSGIAGVGANRGLMHWSDGKDSRVYAAVDNFVYALDAATGKPIAEFGAHGRIDLRDNLGRDPTTQSVRLTSPGVVFKDLLILGGRVSESLPASPGHIRAYDARSGALRWTFRTIPQPGEAGFETWPKDAWRYIGGANSWPGMTVDEKRGIVYVPTGSAAADFYGANRAGDNLYANCLIALDATTGRKRWHYQFVRHDVLDRDLPTAPTLLTIVVKGRRIDALAQPTKQGYLFVLNRETGEPVFPVEEVPAPGSDMPGEIAAPTFRRPTRPAPYARQNLSARDLTHRTPEASAWAKAEFAKIVSDGPFKPLTLGRDTAIYPGFDGGAEWGGPAYDPSSGLLYVNSNEMAWLGSLALNDTGRSTGRSIYRRDCAACHGDDGRGSPPQFPSLTNLDGRMKRVDFAARVRAGGGRMPAFPHVTNDAMDALVTWVYDGKDIPVGELDESPMNQKYRFTGYRRWLDPDGYPAVGTPWGTLNAIHVESGKIAWSIPFGEFPELAARGSKDTGSENYGGPLVTDGGLLFIGASIHDRKFRAFDKATGAKLWEAALPYSADATPITYRIDGRQYVAIFASGGKERGGSGGGVYLAWALPDEEKR